MRRRSKAQAAIEYILATVAFTLVAGGVVTIIMNESWKKAGTIDDYDLVSGNVRTGTLIGATLEDGVPVNKVWPGQDTQYEGSWKNPQTMHLVDLDQEELDPAERRFYSSRNTATPERGLEDQRQMDARAREEGGEAFWNEGDENQWSNTGSRSEWATTSDENAAPEATQTASTQAAVESGHRDFDSLDEARSLEGDYQRYNQQWLDSDGHRDGYRSDFLQTIEE